jgi:hypothetical protein
MLPVSFQLAESRFKARSTLAWPMPINGGAVGWCAVQERIVEALRKPGPHLGRHL